MRRTTSQDRTPEGIRLFRIQLTVLVVIYTLAVYSGIYALTRTLVFQTLRTEGASYFALVVDMRNWNASHGAVWVPKTQAAPTNPYLERLGIEPDIQTDTGGILTMRNPSAMTREVSELTNRRNGVSFHLMSVDFLNPKNAPDEWETQALAGFERGESVRHGVTEVDGVRYYRYAAPLAVDQSCLGCHRAQGYEVGDIRGGMTVSIPMAETDLLLERAAYFAGGLAVLTLTGALLTLGLLGERMEDRVKAANDRLHEMATTDALTGVRNRGATLQRLQEEFERARRTSGELSIVMLDLDHFKKVNDTFGHATGDCVLKSFAVRTGDSLRRYDTVGRIGGEEFLVLAPGTGMDAACELAERIRAAIDAAPIACEPGISLTVSGGVATLTDQDVGIDSLLQRADDALYAAKRAGRDCVRCWAREDDDSSPE